LIRFVFSILPRVKFLRTMATFPLKSMSPQLQTRQFPGSHAGVDCTEEKRKPVWKMNLRRFQE
jgi:hypothetical protein